MVYCILVVWFAEYLLAVPNLLQRLVDIAIKQPCKFFHVKSVMLTQVVDFSGQTLLENGCVLLYCFECNLLVRGLCDTLQTCR